MKKAIIVVLVILLAILSIYSFINFSDGDKLEIENENNLTNELKNEESDQTKDVEEEKNKTKTVIGNSVEDNEIVAYHHGNGDKNLLFVAGVHGGYDWNTALLAYELNDYFTENPNEVPENLRVTIIPVLNPDGLEEKTGKIGPFVASDVSSDGGSSIGRFNANGVDLNRNFDCDWQETGLWQNKEVSGGTEVFSEPESQALKDYVERLNPAGVVVWYSAAGGVYASSCHGGVLEETRDLTRIFAEASGYSRNEEFDFYEITGDLVNWLAKKEIPAISVLLTNHEDIEWSKNISGVRAVFDYYTE